MFKNRSIEARVLIKSIVIGILSGLILGHLARSLSFDIYSLVAFGLYVIINFSFSRDKNVVFYICLDWLYIANLLIYFNIVKCSYNDYIYGLVLLIFIVVLQLKNIRNILRNYTRKTIYSESLYYEREKDKIAILNYLDSFNVFGINSEWGSGKTFLMNSICKEKKCNYHFIKIDTTAYNIDDIGNVLINEMDMLLKENGILSLYSSTIFNVCKSNDSLSIINNLLFNNQVSNSKRIAGFREELQKLDKQIVFIFEDIDRIDDKKVISKIFGIANNIVSYSSNIKVIYEYRRDKLLRLFNEDTNFLEKYIPYTINLTHISFKSLLTKIYETSQDSFQHIYPDWFNFLCEDHNFNYDIGASGIGFMYNLVEEFYRDRYSVRKIKNFMLEVDSFFCSNNNIELTDFSKIRNAIVLYFFIKHFDEYFYSRFNSYWNDIFDIFQVKEKGNSNLNEVGLTYTDFYNLFFNEKSNNGFVKKFSDLISDDDNKKSLAFIDAFCINLAVDYGKNRVLSNNGTILSFLLVTYEPIIYKAKHVNDKIICFIKSLHEHGSIVKTRDEMLCNVFLNNYLKEGTVLTLKTYKDFDLYCHKGQYYYNYHIDPFLYSFTETIDAVFVAMYVSNVSTQFWIKFLDFFQKEYLKNPSLKYDFSTSIIGKFNFIDINDIDVLWKALDILRNISIPKKYPFDTEVFIIFWRLYFNRIFAYLNIKKTEEDEAFCKMIQSRSFTNYESYVAYFVNRIRTFLLHDNNISELEKNKILYFLYQCENMIITIRLQID